jgi:hypothetical protein
MVRFFCGLRKLLNPIVAVFLLTSVVVGQNRPTTGVLALPLSFEANQGQVAPEFGFVAQTAGVTLKFSNQEIVFTGCANDKASNCPAQQLFRMRFQSGRPAQVSGENQSGKANYYIGKDPSAWRTGIPMYRALRYRAIYPGIDLLFHGYAGKLEYDLMVAPRANPNLIALEISGAMPSIESGELVLDVHGRQFRFKRPAIYQVIAGTRRTIAGNYVRRDDGRIGFRIGAYDHQRELVIDPVLTYAGYIGGKPGTVYGTAVDSVGNVILTGETGAIDFPVTPGAAQTALSGYTDGFVSKIDPSGQQFVYSTYFGGGDRETAYAVAADENGDAYITGVTSSYDLPTTANAFSKTCPGICNTPFAAKFGPDGSLVYSTYLGASNAVARAIAADSQGSAYITGIIASADLPLVNAFQSTLPEQVSTSGVSAFVQKLDPSGSSLVYSTYLGGLGEDVGRGIAVDSSGSAYVVGNSAGLPVRNPLQAEGPGAFITKFTPDGTDLVYSTLFGGSSKTEADAVAVDSSGTAYITGVTMSPDFPLTVNAFKGVCAGSMGTSCTTPEAFVLVLEPSGASVRYSTFLGEGYASGIAADANSNAFISGWTSWSDFPLIDALENTVAHLVNGSYMFVTKLDSQGMPLLSTVLGGYWTSQSAGGIAVNNGTIYVGGTANANSSFTTHPDFPLVNAMTSSICCNNQSPVLAKIGPGNGPALSVSPLTAPLVVVRNVSSSTLTFNSITTSSDFQQSGDCGSSLAPGADCILYLRSTNTAAAGTLSIDSNASSTPAVFTIDKAKAVDSSTSAYLVIAPNNQLLFPPTLIGESTTRSVLVRNVGAGTGNVSVSTYGNFQTTNHCAGSVAPGTSCTIDVTFTPTITGAAGGQLGINNDTIYLSGWGTTAPLLPSATMVSFGTQYVGFTGFSRTITLQNVTGESRSYSGLNVSSAFAATADCPATIPARSSCHVTLTFSPTTNAFYQGSLTIPGAASVALYGTGRILSDLALSTLDVQYGYTLIAGPFPTQDVTVTNKSANAINISAVSVTGDFSQTSNCIGTLAAQAACTITVTFVPTTESDRYGQLSITHDGTGSPQQASLHGLGQNYLHLTPSPVDFGHQAVGSTSGWHYLSVGNNSNIAVTISSITVSDSVFAIAQNPCPTPLQPFFGCALQFTFTPGSPGLHRATVTVTTSNPASTETATLQGIGDGPEIALSAQSLDFGTVELGAAPRSRTVYVTNSGTTDVTVSSIFASGDFSETNTCPVKLAAEEQCSIAVSFKPSATGARSGNLSIAANVNSSPRTVSLTGNGADLQFVSSNSSVTTQTVKAGQTATFTLQVSGSPGFSDSVTFACANVPAGYTCSPNPLSLTLGSTAQNVTVTVTTPTAVGGITAPGSMSPLTPTATLAFGSTLAFMLLLLRRRKLPSIAVATFLALALLPACGGGGSTSKPSPQPPVVTPQTYTIIVTATSNAGVVKSTTLTLTVN